MQDLKETQMEVWCLVCFFLERQNKFDAEEDSSVMKINAMDLNLASERNGMIAYKLY
jgi:hypothetical protein